MLTVPHHYHALLPSTMHVVIDLSLLGLWFGVELTIAQVRYFSEAVAEEHITPNYHDAACVKWSNLDSAFVRLRELM